MTEAGTITIPPPQFALFLSKYDFDILYLPDPPQSATAPPQDELVLLYALFKLNLQWIIL